MNQSVSMIYDSRALCADKTEDRVVALAGQVIAMLRLRDGSAMPLDDRRVAQMADRMIAAALSDETDSLFTLAMVLRREGISGETMTDAVMPHAARELGRAWEDDRLSFIEVSTAMARIQRLLRDALFEAPQDGDGASILFILPEGEQHTLGGLVAVRMLRRMGLSACLSLGEKPRSIADVLRTRRFDAVFVSVATEEALESARDLVEAVRIVTAAALPVAIGGALLCGAGHAVTEAIRARTGAMIVSNDLDAVIGALNLAPAAVQRANSA